MISNEFSKKEKYIVFFSLFFILEIFVFYIGNDEFIINFKGKSNLNLNKSLKSSYSYNIALGCICSAESVGMSQFPEYANDGISAVWDNGWRAESEHSSSWWKVQFNETNLIDHVNIYFRSIDYLGIWFIEVSNSSSFTGEEIIVDSGTGNTLLTINSIFSPIIAAYLRIRGTVAGGLPNLEPFIHEVEVFGWQNIENSAPSITHPTDFEYIKGTTGNTISWTIVDESVYSEPYFQIHRNMTTIANGNWISNTPIIINIDGLLDGLYNYSIYANDGFNGTVNDDILIRVIISSPSGPLPPIDYITLFASIITIIVGIIAIYEFIYKNRKK